MEKSKELKKQEEPEKQKELAKKNFWGTMLLISVLIIFLLILIIVNPNGIVNSSSSDNIDGEDIITYMKDNNIIIYSSSTCPYCKKQLEEFTEYQSKVIEEGLYIYCDLTQDMGCIGVESVPTWKKDRKIVYVGYLPLDEIKDVL